MVDIDPNLIAEMQSKTVRQLVEDHERIDTHVTAETKRFNDYITPYKTRMDAIKNELLRRMNEQGCDNFKTESGTAYKSVIDSFPLENQEKYLDWCLDNWDKYGVDMLQVGAPKKDAVRRFMQENGGQLPPNMRISSFARVNIRRS